MYKINYERCVIDICNDYLRKIENNSYCGCFLYYLFSFFITQYQNANRS